MCLFRTLSPMINYWHWRLYVIKQPLRSKGNSRKSGNQEVLLRVMQLKLPESEIFYRSLMLRILYSSTEKFRRCTDNIYCTSAFNLRS